VTRYAKPAPVRSLEAVVRAVELKTAWHPVGT
jgi:hypothetical protein